jgi:dTDP-glucose 4,6-dehydratase
MFVDDACSAIDLLAADPRPGETFNIAPEGEPVTNLEVARMVAEVVGRDPSCVYLTDYDRPDHDRRYSVDSSKLRSLGWRAERTFHEALVETVEWYQANEWWWKPLLDEAESLYEDGSHRVRVKERS